MTKLVYNNDHSFTEESVRYRLSRVSTIFLYDWNQYQNSRFDFNKEANKIEHSIIPVALSEVKDLFDNSCHLEIRDKRITKEHWHLRYYGIHRLDGPAEWEFRSPYQLVQKSGWSAFGVEVPFLQEYLDNNNLMNYFHRYRKIEHIRKAFLTLATTNNWLSQDALNCLELMASFAS